MEIKLEKIDEFRWRIPKKDKMRVDGLIFANEKLLKLIKEDQSLLQVANVATLPGIINYSIAMPDIHWGYGFPIGGVAAFDFDEGVISPGGVGYDINCGCRLMTTNLKAYEIKPFMERIVNNLFKDIPTGVGSTGAIKLSKEEEEKVALMGAEWAVKKGYGDIEDLERIEDGGRMDGADPSFLSEKAIKRGHDQLGTLGSGNHFLEVQMVEEIYDQRIAQRYNLFKGQVTVLIHSGSRGFGHQICDDFLKEMARYVIKENIELPDRQLACARIRSELGKRYWASMACAANYAWANRQILMHKTEESLCKTLSIAPRELAMKLLYDVCHNIAKREKHVVGGTEIWVCVHRKGATRALPPGHPLLPEIYKDVGQPVLIPGDMGTYSYVLAGAKGSMVESFGSSCHGAGRVLSRTQATKRAKGRSIRGELEKMGILVQARGKKTLMEEMPEAYKDVADVVDVVHGAGLATKVARLRPLAVIKG